MALTPDDPGHPDYEGGETEGPAAPPPVPYLEDEGGHVCRLIDPNLFSGSSDVFRNNVGGYFFNITNQSGNLESLFWNFQPEMGRNEIMGAMYKKTKNDVIASVYSYPLGKDVEIAGQPSAANKLVPNYTFIVAVDGHPEKIPNDKFWKTLWLGGEYDRVTYDPIYQNSVFDDYYTAYHHPYKSMAKQYLTNPAAVTSYSSISFEYNHHLKKYQSYAKEIEDHECLPDINLNTWAFAYSSGAHGVPDWRPDIYNYISFDGQFDNPGVEFLSMSAFLDEKIPNATPYTEGTKNWAYARYKNVMFPDSFYSSQIGYNVAVTASSYPIIANVNFPAAPGGPVRNSIAARNFSSRLLVLLKEVFNNQTTVPVKNRNFHKQRRYLTASAISDNKNDVVSEGTLNQFRCVDLHEMLIYSYHKIKNEIEDYFLIDCTSLNGGSDAVTRIIPEDLAEYDSHGNYRHLNCSNTLQVMEDVVDYLDSSSGIQDLESLYNLRRQTPFEETPEPATTPQERETEVIAYRVDKIGGPPTGDSSTTGVLQTYWFFNSTNMWENFDFYDSQVKYGQEYTYKVYEYRIVQGIKYRYSNLQISRIIGVPVNGGVSGMYTETLDSTDPDFNPPFYCIEYYDPYTGQAKDDLLNPNNYYGGGGAFHVAASPEGLFTADPDGGWASTDLVQSYAGNISSLASDAQRIAQTRAKVDWESGDSARPYMANFLVTTEPRYQIFEIPVCTKTIKITDNPPNKLNVFPNYLLDNSNTLKFQLQHEGFARRPYTTTITNSDEIDKIAYLHSKDMMPNAIVEKESVSQHRYIQMFRLDERPTSLQDFRRGILTTQDLIMDVGEYTYNDYCMYDKIPSNRKFYYAFRVVNENGVGGFLKEVLEAEFINDGGYKYALFNVLFEEDLPPKTHTNTTRTTKKVFQISPSRSQASLDSSDADYNKNAAEEFQAGKIKLGLSEDLVWDKVFKVRLTSKKTGKKLDLNITYTHNTEILGTE